MDAPASRPAWRRGREPKASTPSPRVSRRWPRTSILPPGKPA